MKRLWMFAAVCLLAMQAAGGALAQQTMEVYVARGALEETQARQLIGLLGRAFPQAQWSLDLQAESGGSLLARVLEDCAPDLAICAPGEALPFEKAGMLLPLQSRIEGLSRVQRQVIDPCVWEEDLFMAPLIARHRRIAVNARQFDALRLHYMLDSRAHPVWYPTEFYQILEEFLLMQRPAMEIWPAGEDGAALEALTQAIYGGSLLSEDGETCLADTPEMVAGVKWLGDAVEGGLIGMAESRAAALARFVAGETAMFIDWTDEEAARQARALELGGIDVVEVPYPSSIGLPVRAFDLIGLCAFAGGDADSTVLKLQAVAFLNEDAGAQAVLGERRIMQDSAVWLPILEAGSPGATLRAMYQQALREVIEQEADAQGALTRVRRAMDALLR